MSDLELDELSEAFAAFTNDASREVVMPSSAAIRRTVARRRATTVGACGAVALAAIGGIAYGATHLDGQQGGQPTVLARPSPTYPVATPLPTTSHQFVNSTGNFQDSNGSPQTQMDDDASHHAAGIYYMTFVCTGGGSVSLSYVINGSGPTLDYACDGTAHTSGQSVPRAGNNLVVTIVPDDMAAAARAAYAYRIEFGAHG